MAKESVIIPFKNKDIVLKFEEFDSEIDVDDAVKIDYHNLFAEIITIPVMMNRIGMWKAQSENDYALARLARDINAAKLGEQYRRKLMGKDSKGNPKMPTKDQVDNAVLLDDEMSKKIKGHHHRCIRLQKEAAYMDSLYWAVKSKEMKLNRISDSMNLIPEEFEKNIVEGKWNGILIKAQKKKPI